MIYVPMIDDYSCFVILNDKTIRAYVDTPVIDSLVEYRDYYINSHYLYVDGFETVSKVPVCIENERLTNEVYYRNDFSHILVIFMILSFVCFYIPTRIILRIFKKV